MATVTVNSWTITAVNPDGTDNLELPVKSGVNPTNEYIDYVGMGMRMKLELDCELTGNYSDSSTADMVGTMIRYVPAMFVPTFTSFIPLGTFPSGGYTAQPTSNTAESYEMQLSFKDGEFAPSNINGTIILDVIDSTKFKITHMFRMTSDVENYLIGREYQNQFRLTKSSQYNDEELNTNRESVYGYEKSLNILIATRQRNFDTILKEELRVRFRASFNNYDERRILKFIQSYIATRPIGNVTTISSFEDTEFTISWQDPTAQIIEDEVSLLIAERNNQSNVSTFERDLRLSEVKLVTTGGTGNISAAVKAPISYNHSAGITSVTFTIDKDYISFGKTYDIHMNALYQNDPSSRKDIHTVISVSGISEMPKFPLDAESNFYSRNGSFGNNFTATVMERIANNLHIDYESYDEFMLTVDDEPFVGFMQDTTVIGVEIRDDNNNVIFQSISYKDTTTNEYPSGDLIVIHDEVNKTIDFWLSDLRMLYENFQNLPNMGDGTFLLRWKIMFAPVPGNNDYNMEYRLESTLNVNNYENYKVSGRVVENVRFVDPNTSFLISDWCDLQSVIVLADVSDLEDTKFTIFIDRFPLGDFFTQTFSLQEQNDTISVVNEISNMETSIVDTIQYDSGVVSFNLDISELTGDIKYRVSIQSYKQ